MYLHFQRKILAVAWVCLLGTAVASERVAMCGDSITAKDVYTRYVRTYLRASAGQPVAVRHFGVPGEIAASLLHRIDREIAPFAPTTVTVMYGMNDGDYRPYHPAYAGGYEQNLERIVRELRARGVVRIYLASPPPVDTFYFTLWEHAKSTPTEYNENLKRLGAAARAVAERNGVVWVDVNAACLRAMELTKQLFGEAYPYAKDGVHPSFGGHLAIAYAFLKAMGCEGDIGLITVDAATGIATGSADHSIVAVDDEGVWVESTRYPFCFTDDPSGLQSTRLMLSSVPFNQELNRYILRVTGATRPLVVTWGADSKIFTPEELEVGINLAAEFSNNPFRPYFEALEQSPEAPVVPVRHQIKLAAVSPSET